MPSIDRLLETALYVENLERAARFYIDLFGCRLLNGGSLESQVGAPGAFFCPLEIPGRQVLLLFRKGSCVGEAKLPGGTIPPHDGDGRLHLAFAIPADSLDAWRECLSQFGVPIEGEMAWERGGRSIYFRDPDGHLLELATPGLWTIY